MCVNESISGCRSYINGNWVEVYCALSVSTEWSRHSMHSRSSVLTNPSWQSHVSSWLDEEVSFLLDRDYWIPSRSLRYPSMTAKAQSGYICNVILVLFRSWSAEAQPCRSLSDVSEILEIQIPCPIRELEGLRQKAFSSLDSVNR